VLRVVATIVTLSVVAVAVDRVTLWIWRYRINAYYQSLRASAGRLANRHGLFDPDSLVNASHDKEPWPVPLLEVAFQGPDPQRVIVDGDGGLNFFYTPPLLAWSRHVPWAYRHPVIQGSDIYPYNDVYMVRIATQESPHKKVFLVPQVSLDHGLPF